MQSHQKEIYQLWAEKNVPLFQRPDERRMAWQIDRSRRFFIDRYFPAQKDAAVIDLGFGWGVFLKACKDAGYRNISGVEFSEACVKFAQEELGLSNLVAGDIQEFLATVPDASADVITAFDVLEHFPKSEILTVLRAVYAKLKPGGTFIMQSPNGASMAGMYIFHSDLTHETAFTDALIEEVCTMTGFASVSVMPEPGLSRLKTLLKAPFQGIIKKVMGFDNQFAFTANLVAVAKK